MHCDAERQPVRADLAQEAPSLSVNNGRNSGIAKRHGDSAAWVNEGDAVRRGLVRAQGYPSGDGEGWVDRKDKELAHRADLRRDVYLLPVRPDGHAGRRCVGWQIQHLPQVRPAWRWRWTGRAGRGRRRRVGARRDRRG